MAPGVEWGFVGSGFHQQFALRVTQPLLRFATDASVEIDLPRAFFIDIAEAIPHARLKIVPDAGHYLPLERPDLVADELTAWLAMPVPHTAKEPS